MKDDTSLRHYGVIGMKWGIRRARSNKLKRITKKPFPITLIKKMQRNHTN